MRRTYDSKIELGLDTFGDIQAGPDGQLLGHAQVIRNVIDEGVLADEVDVHCIGLGEHHRPDFAISSPEVLLAAIASRTKRVLCRIPRNGCAPHCQGGKSARHLSFPHEI